MKGTLLFRTGPGLVNRRLGIARPLAENLALMKALDYHVPTSGINYLEDAAEAREAAVEDVTIALGIGADPNLCNREGLSPLAKAIEHLSLCPDVIYKLLRGGADPNLRLSYDLAELEKYEHSNVIDRAKSRRTQGDTAIHRLARNISGTVFGNYLTSTRNEYVERNYVVLHQLLAKGANLNIADSAGDTPCHLIVNRMLHRIKDVENTMKDTIENPARYCYDPESESSFDSFNKYLTSASDWDWKSSDAGQYHETLSRSLGEDVLMNLSTLCLFIKAGADLNRANNAGIKPIDQLSPDLRIQLDKTTATLKPYV
jgi:hypothetical protein